jgi:hypothetical protein
MTPKEALATDWPTFPPGTFVRERTSESSTAGSYTTTLDAIEAFEAAVGDIPLCDSDD